MTRPDPRVPVPDLRVAIIVTKAPSEPWPVVRTTLEAMLAQDYPERLTTSGWPTSARSRRSARLVRRRAACTCRHASASPTTTTLTWPRRTKSKEGNLAYFYDTVGYHELRRRGPARLRPRPGRRTWPPWSAPSPLPVVGYTCAPSICDSNTQAGWTVRGQALPRGDPARSRAGRLQRRLRARSASGRTTRYAPQPCGPSEASGLSWRRTTAPPSGSSPEAGTASSSSTPRRTGRDRRAWTR